MKKTIGEKVGSKKRTGEKSRRIKHTTWAHDAWDDVNCALRTPNLSLSHVRHCGSTGKCDVWGVLFTHRVGCSRLLSAVKRSDYNQLIFLKKFTQRLEACEDLHRISRRRGWRQWFGVDCLRLAGVVALPESSSSSTKKSASVSCASSGSPTLHLEGLRRMVACRSSVRPLFQRRLGAAFASHAAEQKQHVEEWPGASSVHSAPRTVCGMGDIRTWVGLAHLGTVAKKS